MPPADSLAVSTAGKGRADVFVSQERAGIVVRTKNRPSFLRRALRDILAQTSRQWVVRIVNDGGDPADVERALAELPEDARGRVEAIHHSAAHGRSAAANAGILALDTEFVVLHDDDDLWHPQFLERAMTHLDDHAGEIGVIVRTEIVYEAQRDGVFVETGRAPFWADLHEITFSDLLQVNRAVPISFLYRRVAHEEVGLYREDLHVVEDWDFNLRVAARHPIGFIDGEPLAYWMQRVGVGGELGNSMYALAGEHEHYDKLVRDEALRAYVAQHGPGLPLYLARYIQEEVGRQLDQRRSLGQHVTAAVRAWRRQRRGR